MLQAFRLRKSAQATSVQDMSKDAFSHIDTWVFDLDNTLYHPSVRLFDQIEALMTEYVMNALNVDEERAHYLRKHYWNVHGTTLAGLMREHDLDPAPYLEAVHDIDFSVLTKDPDLAAAISNLPGRKFVYTNGTAPYAQNVLMGRGLDGLMDGVFGIENADYHPKPDHAAFTTIFEKAEIDPKCAAMFEDDIRNLAVPKQMRMRTVHVADDVTPADHVEFHTSHLSVFLSQLV